MSKKKRTSKVLKPKKDKRLKIDLLLASDSWVLESILRREFKGVREQQKKFDKLFPDIEYNDLLLLFATELRDRYYLTNLTKEQEEYLEKKLDSRPKDIFVEDDNDK